MVKEKTFLVRFDKEVWRFVKKMSAEQERSMNDIVVECLRKLIEKHDKKLQSVKK